MDLISVIVPVYNVENYLHECLDSILSQTYQNLEIILVNDGSTDGSGKICEEYAAKDSRIQVIHQENGGLSHARNIGIASASGSYLTLIDSDDGIHEPFIQTLYEYLLEYDADIAISNYYKYDERDGNFYFHNLNQADLVELLSPQECIDYQCDIKEHVGVSTITAWGKLFKKSLFEGINFPVGRLMEDEMTIHKLYLKSNQIVFVNQNHYLYRIRETGITKSSKLLRRRAKDIISAYEIKLTDLILSGLNCDRMIGKFQTMLWIVKGELAGLDDAKMEYQEIVQRLKWLEKREDIT